MSAADKRNALKAKIEAAEMRNALRSAGDTAQDAAEMATDFVKRHPLAAIAGVAVLGLAIGAMTKPGREAGKKAGSNARKFAGYASEIGLAYAAGLLASLGDVVSDGKDAIEDATDKVTDNAGTLKRKAIFSGGNAAAAAKSISREAGKKAGRALRDMGNATKH